ncbi:MAG: hypothetical protein Q7R96_01680 [Nanoarchaeota archaeon]|nr:hypothetical protein [Nanoarchaeota archaeon]
MQKKGQSAMEFLMTYGWAILVVLIAIGALAYFGVLNPAKFLPSQCILFPGLSCSNFKVGASTASFVVQNGAGQNLGDLNITISNPNQGSCTTNSTATANITDGATSTYTITCAAGTFGSPGDRYKADLNVSYYDGTGSNKIYHIKKGSIVTQVE